MTAQILQFRPRPSDMDTKLEAMIRLSEGYQTEVIYLPELQIELPSDVECHDG